MAYNKDREEDRPLTTIAKELFNPPIDTRQILERGWYRNILYYIGEQWITWDSSQKGFRPVYGKAKKKPTPVSNIIRDYVRSMKAMILNKQYIVRVWPESEKIEDKQAAIKGEELLRDIESRDDFQVKDTEEEVALWMILTGTGFIRDYPSMDRGKPLVGANVKTGDVATESIMPFNVFVDDNSGVRLRDKRYVGIQCLKHKDWILDHWPEATIDSSADTQQINYQRTLTRMVAQVSPWKNAGNDTVTRNDVGTEDLVLFREIEFAPTKKYPKGRWACFVGDTLLEEKDRLPIPVEGEKWMFSLEDFRYNLVPGRFWGESGINDLISPQNIINRIDQALVMNRKGIGRPIVITPGQMKLKKKTSGGSSFLHISYDPQAARGSVPVIGHGKSLPQQVLEERNIQKATSQDSAGNPKNVLQGQAPTSSASGVMVDILRETAEQGHAPDVNRYYRALARSNRKRLIIVQELYTEERMVKTGENGKITVKKFKGSDLRKNTDVRLELTSGLSSTNAGKVNTIQGLVQSGFFNPQVVPIPLRNELLEKLAISGFKDKVSKDLERADKENGQLVNGVVDFYLEQQVVGKEGQPIMVPQPNPEDPTGDPIMVPLLDPETGQPPWEPLIEDPIFDLDDHEIHAESHRQFMITQEFSELEDKAQTVFLSHYQAHLRRVQEAIAAQEQRMMQQQAMMTAAQNQPAPQEGAPQ